MPQLYSIVLAYQKPKQFNKNKMKQCEQLYLNEFSTKSQANLMVCRQCFRALVVLFLLVGKSFIEWTSCISRVIHNKTFQVHCHITSELIILARQKILRIEQKHEQNSSKKRRRRRKHKTRIV